MSKSVRAKVMPKQTATGTVRTATVSPDIPSTDKLKTPGDWVYAGRMPELPWPVELVTVPRTADEKHGGIDFLIHPPKFWDCTVRLRPPEILKDGYPVLKSFQNRMPYDVGHVHRRWWMTDVELEYPDGHTTKTTVHDGYRSSENLQDYVIDERFTRWSFVRLYRAISHYCFRRLASPATALYSWNEKKLPGGNASTSHDPFYVFSLISFITFNNPAYVAFCRNTHKTKHDSSHSYFVAMHGPEMMHGAGELHNYAVHLISQAVEVIVSMISSLISAFGGQMLGEQIEGIASAIEDAYEHVKDYFPDVEKFEEWLKGKMNDWKERIEKSSTTFQGDADIEADIEAALAATEIGELARQFKRRMDDEIIRDNYLVPFMGAIKKMTIILPAEGD